MKLLSNIPDNIYKSLKEEINKFLIVESQESKSIDEAKKLVMQRLGYDRKQADEFIRIKLRNDFPILRDKNAAKFILGITRMFLDKQIQDARTISKLNATLTYVASEAHINEYDRNLNGISAQSLIRRFAKNMMMDLEKDKNDVNAMQFSGDSGYEIVKIDSFEQSSEYGKYTSWCVTHHENLFDSYSANGINQFYFCLKHGFENVMKKPTKGCPLDEYGLSMIAVCVDESGRLSTCTCRWNHDQNGNDNIMNSKQLSQVIGMNFYDVFKPNTLIKDLLQSLKNGENPSVVFDEVSNFGNNLLKIKVRNLYNFLTPDKEILYPDLWFNDLEQFNNGFCKVEKNGLYNIINTNGEFLWNSPLNEWLDDIEYIESCGMFMVFKYDTVFNEEDEGETEEEVKKYNFINSSGNLTWDKPFEKWFDDYDWSFFRNINNFNVGGGFMRVQQNNKWNVVDSNGNLIFNNWFFLQCSCPKNGFIKADLGHSSHRYDINLRTKIGLYADTKKMNTIIVNGEPLDYTFICKIYNGDIKFNLYKKDTQELVFPDTWFDDELYFWDDHNNNFISNVFIGWKVAYNLNINGDLYDPDTKSLIGKIPTYMNCKNNQIPLTNETLSKSYKNIISETMRKKLLEYAGNYDPINDIAEDTINRIKQYLLQMVIQKKHSMYLANPKDAALFTYINMMNTRRFNGLPIDIINAIRYNIAMEMEIFGQPLLIHIDCFDTSKLGNFNSMQFDLVKNIIENPASCGRTRSGQNIINLLFTFEFHPWSNKIFVEDSHIISSLGHEMLHAIQNDRNWAKPNQELEIAYRALTNVNNDLAGIIGYLSYLAIPYETSANIHEIGLDIKKNAQEIMEDDEFLYGDGFSDDYIIEQFKNTRIYQNIKYNYDILMMLTKKMPIERILISVAVAYIDDENFNLENFIRSFTTLVPKMIRRANKCWYIHSMKWLKIIKQRWQENAGYDEDYE